MMIISKKKLNEKIAEALERAERERYLHDKIDRVERECREMVEGVHRHLHDIEMEMRKRDNDGT